ncbi:peptidase S9 [Barnesiella viscericola DSM 18177]|uniref:Peptidase S9 n=1 Tax=Barnesiella viscericola DSM 18177 TaxID=880074 RepID=W0EN05_9BACT|nr:S9 family peptidase [Barnesiella viscericola]AHF12190.1 peptidase S9 [Barnesiella viscericola DSM 18177]
MKKITFTILCAIALFVFPARAFTLEDITSGKFLPQDVAETYPSTDGVHYYAATNGNTRIVKCEYRTGYEVDTLFDVKTARECDLKSFDGFSLSPDEKHLLIYADSEPIYRRSFKANYYTFEIRRNLLKPLSEGGKQQVAVYSPNGRMVAFVRDNNIYIKKLDYGTEVAVTRDGEQNKIINGAPDWVYEEEFAMTSTLQWSPDDATLAFVKFDESQVPLYSFQLYEGYCPALPEYRFYPGSFAYKYPVAGETNSQVSVFSYTVDTRALKKMNLPLTADSYIPRIQFTPDPNRLAVVSLNRTQNQMDIYTVNPKSGVSKLLLRETDKAWIDEPILDNIAFYPDFFIIASCRSGYQHLYRYNYNGTLARQITRGEWNVSNFLGYDAQSGSYFYESNQEGALYKAIYKMNAKGVETKLSTLKGTNTAEFNPSCTYFINRYSSVDEPLVVTVCDARGKTLRTLEDNASLKALAAQSGLPQKEFFTCANAAGDLMNGYILKPANFDPSKRYPVVMSQYSGPGSQSVLDNWKVDWEYYLANQGFIVACVDGRGTGGRSRAYETAVYMQLGKYETEDQVAGAEYMSTLPYVDGNRIGIYGWSYGGYETLMAMSTGNGIYRAGVAIAPVTDWRYYDTIYSERFMRTPQENGDGYRQSAPITHAANLKGSLLIVSGTADDNVHYLNTLQYSAALVEAGIQFDSQIYTNKDHHIRGCNTRHHLYTRVCNFFSDKLK